MREAGPREWRMLHIMESNEQQPSDWKELKQRSRVLPGGLGTR